MRRTVLRALAALVALALPGAAFAQTSAADFTSAVRYDDENRLTGTIAPDPDGTGPLHYAATRTTYDAAGRATKVETGELSSWQSDSVAPSAWTGFTVLSQIDTIYDALDRKVMVTLSSGGSAYGVTQYSYDVVGRLDCTAVRMNPATFASLPASTPACELTTTSITYGPDRITKNAYDDAGRLLKVVKAYRITPANGFANLQQDYVTYTYSANGKPLSVKDANGNVAGYTYDGFDRLTKWAFPDKTATGSVSTTDYEEYDYDLNGNRTTLRKRDGRTLTYWYDNLDRVIIKIVPDACVSGYACTTPPSSATRDVYYGYDARGQQLYARFDGPTGADTVDNAYDGFGRLESQTTAMYGVSRTVSYRYDADGNRIRITHPDGVYFTTDYDGLDRASAVKENGATTIASMTYDAAGREGSETRDTVTTTFGYDGVGRLSSLDDDLPGGTGNDITTTLGYNYASQLVSRTRTNPGVYAFTGPDGGGYPTVSRAYTVNGLNQYATVAGTTIGYDSNGNLVSDGTTSYTYDAENRMVSATNTAGYTFAYDPLGRLYGTIGTAAKSTVYDGDQRIVDYTANASVVAMRWVMGPGSDNPLMWYAGGTLSDRRSLQADERGSIVSAVDATGAVIGINSYDEYGIPAASNIGRYGYTGQVWVSTIGMWYYKARMYSPTHGRFMQTDPIGYADQNNLYTYVGNDPMDRTDPTGMFGLLGGCPPGSACGSSNVASSNAADRYGASANQSKAASPIPTAGTGTIIYKAGVPLPSSQIGPVLQCTADCVGGPIRVTSTSDSHPPGDVHTRGVAADITSSNPRGVMVCAAKCGAQFQLNEYTNPSKNATGGHVHIQLVPGRNGAVGPYRMEPGTAVSTSGRIFRTTGSSNGKVTANVPEYP